MPLGQTLFHQEVRTLLQRLAYLQTEALVRQPSIARNQLLVQPSRTDGTDLAFHRQRRTQFDGDITKPTGVMLPASFLQVSRYPPDALIQPLHDTGPTQRFQAAYMTFDQRIGIVSLGGF
ncbi:hypothetical protein D9M68_883250 [compost metagenome]